MEPKDTSPCSKGHGPGPYSEPGETSAYPKILCL